ncbi:MAG: glutamate--tRNA ligase, partial [Candidatus Zixiibacteriota bacterium]
GATTKYWLETRWDYLRDVIRLLKSRAKRLSDFVSQGAYFFDFDYKYDEKAAAKHFSRESAELLTDLTDRFESAEAFADEDVERMLTLLAEEKELKKARLIHPTRLAVTGRPDGPGLYDLLATIGRPEVVKRMRAAVAFIEKQA